jgi:hypothetical protein
MDKVQKPNGVSNSVLCNKTNYTYHFLLSLLLFKCLIPRPWYNFFTFGLMQSIKFYKKSKVLKTVSVILTHNIL